MARLVDAGLIRTTNGTGIQRRISMNGMMKMMRNLLSLSKPIVNSKSPKCLNCSKNTVIKTLSFSRAENKRMRS